MSSRCLDTTDRTILSLLQNDARNHTATEIANKAGVSDGTIRNRIRRLREDGIIKKFVPVINYERAGYEFKTVIICTAPVSDRHELVEETKELNEVTFVRELMTGSRNVHVTVVASDKETITDVGNRLNDIGLTVESKEQILRDCVQPFGEF